MKSHVPPIEIRSTLEREAWEMRQAWYALEGNYSLEMVLSLSVRTQEIYWKLREGGTR